MTDLHLAAYQGDLDWVEKCLESGSDVDARDAGGFTPLHWVVDMGMVGPKNDDRAEIVRLLINSGADIEALNEFGESVLFRAVLAGNHDLVELLLRANANIDTPDHRGDKPIDVATANEDFKMVALLENAADGNL